jgi:hypothetical protein
VSGPGGWAPPHYADPVWCFVCAEVEVSARGEVCAECAIDAEEDRAIPGYDRREEEAAVMGRDP